MDTDEYEISLSRELAVCRHEVRKLERALLRLEGRNSGEGDLSTLREAQRALLEGWRKREREYQALLLMARKR